MGAEPAGQEPCRPAAALEGTELNTTYIKQPGLCEELHSAPQKKPLHGVAFLLASLKLISRRLAASDSIRLHPAV